MLIRILSNHYIKLEQISASQDKAIADRFSVAVPSARFIDTEFWDGVVRKYDKSKQILSRALLRELELFLNQKGIPYDIADGRKPSTYESVPIDEVGKDFLEGITLEDFQVAGIKATYAEDVGILHYPTGAGKGELIAGIAKAHKRPTVVIAEQIIVINQLKNRLELRNVVESVGMFCAGKTPSGQNIIVGSIASLSIPSRPKKPEVPTKDDAVGLVNTANAIIKDWAATIGRRFKLDASSIRKIISDYDAEIQCRDDLRLADPKCEYASVWGPTAIAAYNINMKQLDEIVTEYHEVFKLITKNKVSYSDLNVVSALRHLCDEYTKKIKRYDTSMIAYNTRVRNAKLLRALVAKCDLLLVDECDRCSSKQYKPLFKSWFSGRKVYGFSGTPFDEAKPVEELEIKDVLGTVIASESRLTVEKLGRIIPIDYYTLVFGEDNKSEGSAFDIAYNQHVIHNPVFHERVKGITTAFEGDKTLILVDRDDLGTELQRIIPNSRFIHGKTSKRKRDEALIDYQRGEFDVLIGGKILARGLDLHGGCNNLIITTGGKSRQDFKQKIGRALRVNGQGKSRVFDFYFICNKHLYSHSKVRLAAVVNIGYKTIVVYDDGYVSGAELIANRFRRPGKLPGKRKDRRA